VCVSICLCVSVCVCCLPQSHVESHFPLPCPERLSTTLSSRTSFMNNFLPKHRAPLSLTLAISSDPSSSRIPPGARVHSLSHTLAHTYIPLYLLAHTYAHLHTCAHMHTHAHTCTHMLTFAHICTHLRMSGIRDACAGSGCSAGWRQVIVGTRQTSTADMTLHATHWNTLEHTARHCNTLQHTAIHCNTLQHTATHCNT